MAAAVSDLRSHSCIQVQISAVCLYRAYNARRHHCKGKGKRLLAVTSIVIDRVPSNAIQNNHIRSFCTFPIILIHEATTYTTSRVLESSSNSAVVRNLIPAKCVLACRDASLRGTALAPVTFHSSICETFSRPALPAFSSLSSSSPFRRTSSSMIERGFVRVSNEKP